MLSFERFYTSLSNPFLLRELRTLARSTQASEATVSSFFDLLTILTGKMMNLKKIRN